ncbi:MAG: BTAD domain-containing putative transcriptional regulator, partial [Gaiellaceae bacterium]
KPRALLATLLLHANDVVSVDRLTDALWGDEPPETAKNALQVHVSQLRKALGNDLVERRGSGYVIEVASADLDLARFHELCAEAKSLPPAEGAERLRAALALWRGEPEFDRLRLEELRLAALEDRIDLDLELGRHAEVIAELQGLVEAEPLRERPRAQLMLALYRSGRQADALAEFARARETLVDELGVEPGPELQRLQRAVLEQDPSVAAPAAPRHMSRLPAPPTPLIGRSRELAETAALFAGGVRLMTLTGPGGIGKTRLALELARAIEPELEHGAALIRLSTVLDPLLVPDAVAQGIGVPEANRDTLLELLRPRSQLLVLDNFEQLLPAAPFLSELLEAAPEVRLLVTSRAVLHVAGEQEYPVPPLEEAEELFVARAQAVDPSYLPDDAVRDVCTRLEGLPLAIELAAARVKLLSTRAIADRLERSLDLLTAGRADVPTRQQTLRATIDWSYRLLDADEQQLFVRLAVFSGGASIEAIEEVCGGGLDTLASLVDKSLLRSSGDRFAMLELLREYAAEVGVPLDVKQAHLAHYLALAESAQPNQLVAAARLDRLELEHANIRAAVAFAVEQHDRASAVRLAAGLTGFWNIHGYLVEGRGVFEAVLALDGDAPLLALQQCENGLGIMLAELGEFDAAQDAFARALELARELGDPVRVGTTLSNLCNLAQFRGDIPEARRLITAAIDSFSGDEQERNHVIAMSNLGSIEFRDGDLVEADRVFRIVLTLAREIHERREEAQALRWLARVQLDLGAVEDARTLLEESIPATDEVGDRHGIADSLEIAAAVAAAAGAPLEAAQLLGAAEAVRTSIGAHRVPDTADWYARTRTRVEELATPEVFDREYRTGLKLSPYEALGLVRQNAQEPVVPPIR